MRVTFKHYRGRHAFVMESIGEKSLKLLDVGNLGDGQSTGNLLREAVERAGGSYTGLDSNDALAASLNQPQQVNGDLHHAPFDADSFDAIYAGEIIEHSWTPGRMIDECHRILRPGGLLLLDTPNPYSIVHILRFLFKQEDSMGDNRTLTYVEAKNALGELKERGEILLQPQHKIFFTPAMLRQLLETHGFALVSIGATVKSRGVLHSLLLWLFPHAGPHLCVIARKATVDEAFSDIVSAVKKS